MVKFLHEHPIKVLTMTPDTIQGRLLVSASLREVGKVSLTEELHLRKEVSFQRPRTPPHGAT